MTLPCGAVHLGDLLGHLGLEGVAHGRYPDGPDAIGAPADPITGGPFFYRLTPDNRAGRPYLLYSAGLDLVDDGGNADAEAPARAVTSPDRASGFDYIINQPRQTIP